MVRSGGLIVAVVLASPALAREWTDKQGHATSAEFVRIHEDDVILMRGKKVHRVPFADFCADDQEYIRGQLAKKGKEHLVPVDSLRRTWTDQRGRGIEGQFVRLDDEQVVVLRGEQKMHQIAFDKFSAADRAYVREQLTAQGKADLLPPATPDEVAASTPAAPPPAAIVQAPPPAAPSFAPPPVPNFAPPIPRFTPPGATNFGRGGGNALEHMRQQQAEMDAAMQRQRQESDERTRQFQEQAEQNSRQREAERVAANQRWEEQRIGAEQRRAEATARANQQAAERTARMQQQMQALTSRSLSRPPLASSGAPEWVQVTVKTCGGCKQEVPNTLGAGDNCPHCGVFFESEITDDGREIPAPVEKKMANWSLGIKPIVSGVAILIGVIWGLIRKARAG